MRTFYIFEINDEFATLTKNNPYNLYKSMEQIYYTDKRDLTMAYNIYEQMIKPLNYKKINLNLFTSYKDSDYYTRFNNIHMINNFYSDEQTKLVVNKSYMLLKSSIARPNFFDFFKDYQNIFVCDFKNKDYFWLESMLV